ncbi:TonB-dependent receptor [Caulobacter endophyticus]|uniref:TonB-dependent receptor n=1 Tax=Caulobacter endophyticus TaxID=2172652 RepID=UPI00240FC48B|nr:TonB-dependent receptor [Caulobacter endophyticus]MDG2530925.1 TonB-dependent receptor [Caulobacter endophyticus]
MAISSGLSLLQAILAPLAVGEGAPRTDPSAALAEDVIVTAQRRRERHQDVPIALSVVGQDQLARRGARDLSDLAGATPSLSIAGFTGGNASNLVSIRGVAGQVLPIGSGQPVAIYLDGVYLSRPDAAFFGLDDVERIEVLRGPQGALYGRNATAGAVNIITRSPGEAVQGGGEIRIGNLEAISARGSIGGPLSERLSAGLSGSYLRHDGAIRNTVTGDRLNARDARTLRGRLRYRSADRRFEAVLSGDLTRDRATPVFKNAYAPSGAFIGLGDPAVFASDAASQARTLRRTGNDGLSLTLTHRPLETLELVSVTSWRDLDSTVTYDADASAAPSLLTAATNHSATFSQEVRGVFTGRRLRATAGASLFTEQARYGLSTGAPTTPPSFTHLQDHSELTAWAVFGQFEVDLAERLTLVTGLRYDRERRDFTIDYRQAPAPGRLLAGKVEDSVLIPSLGLSYRARPDLLVYAKAGRGYQPPGFNFAPGAATTVANTFRPETLWAYEAGVKAQLADHRLALEAAAFLYDYGDIQIRSTIGLGLTRVDNAASARLAGLEASIVARLPHGFSIRAQGAYLSARYRAFCQAISAGDPQGDDRLCAPGRADRSGNRLNLAPRWSGGLGLDYVRGLGAGRFLASLTYEVAGGVFHVGAANERALRADPWGQLGGEAAFRLASGPEAFIYGRNLTDERFLSFAARVAPTSAFLVINEPRTYGAGIRYRF